MMNEMTAEEAVKILKEQQAEFNEKWVDYGRVNKAYNKAIQALEAQRNLTNEELYQSFIDLEAENERLHDALEAQPCDDCISREVAIKNIKGWFDKIGLNPDILIDSIITLPSVIPKQEVCEDAVSREAVQDLISRWLSDYLLDETREALETINCKVGDMPSVKPKRPKGKWMECGGDEPWLKGYCCSLCNFTTTIKYNYCTCGAEMSGGADETN